MDLNETAWELSSIVIKCSIMESILVLTELNISREN